MTPLETLNNFVSSLELNNTERAEAAGAHVHLRESLAQRLPLHPLHGALLSGSYSRSTAIRPLHDIDVFCVLSPQAGLHVGLNPEHALSRIDTTLRAAYPRAAIRRQRRSVNIVFPGTNIAFDVVPALENVSGVFAIPDRGLQSWLRTNPRMHMERSVEAQRRSGELLKPLTKVAKHWNNRQVQSVQVASFHLEAMGWDILTYKPDNRLAGLAVLFEGYAQRVLRSTPDPAGVGPDLDQGLSSGHRQHLSRNFAVAAQELRRIEALDRIGRSGESVAALRALLGF